MPGSSSSAQKIVDADMQRIGQLCKYVTKPLEDAAKTPDVARELFSALHRRRLMHGFGEWRDWQTWVTEERVPTAPVLVCSVDLGQLFRLTSPGQPPTRVYFEGYVRGERVTEKRDAAEVWQRLEEGVRGQAPALARGAGASSVAEQPCPGSRPRGSPGRHPASESGLSFWTTRPPTHHSRTTRPPF
jgi:hypothetical protein